MSTSQQNIVSEKTYPLSFLENVVRLYDFSGLIEMHFRFELGVEATNYCVQVAGKRYVIKVYEWPENPKGSNNFKAGVANLLHRHGIKTPQVYSNRYHNFITRVDEKDVIVLDFVEGLNMVQDTFNDELIWEVGRETGKMDLALSGFGKSAHLPTDYYLDFRAFLEKEGDVQVLPRQFKREVFAEVFSMFKKITYVFKTLPSGIIHNDVVAHNIIAHEGHLSGVIDFSDMVYGPYVQNIAAALCQTVFWHNWQPHQMPIFLSGYREHHSFSKFDERLLFDLIAARYVLLILGINNRNRRHGEDPKRTTIMFRRYDYLLKFLEFGRDRFDAILSKGMMAQYPIFKSSTVAL